MRNNLVLWVVCEYVFLCGSRKVKGELDGVTQVITVTRVTFFLKICCAAAMNVPCWWHVFHTVFENI